MMNKMFAKRSFSSAILKEKMAGIIATRQQETLAFKKANASSVIGEVTIGQVMGGMRGLPGMHYETSKLDAMDGIFYRGHSLWDVQKKGPKSIENGEPIPEGVLWLLLTGEFPSESEIKGFKEEIYKRGALTDEQENLIKAFPKDMHAMTQFSAGVMMCQPDSHFMSAYHGGVHKSKYWESTFEDALDVCAKVSRIAAIVFHNKYGDNQNMPARDPSLDYGANYANQLGFKDETFWELMRLYITIHA
jgi:citrate synthase